MRIAMLIALGGACLVPLGCQRSEPQPASPVPTASKSKPSSDKREQIRAKAQELMAGVQGKAGARGRLQGAATNVAKGASVPPPKVATPSDVAKAPADASRTPSGVVYTILAPGDGGASPRPEQSALLHYSGWTAKGRLFDSSVSRDHPVLVSLATTSEGWREALRTMTVGERRRVWLSEAQARQPGPTLPSGPLTYDLELIEIVDLGGRACVPGCVPDSDPDAAGLQPDCRVVERRGPLGGKTTESEIAPCRDLGEGRWEFPGDEVSTCARAITDRDRRTPITNDDVSHQCLARGSNLELVVERRDGAAAPPDATISIDCPLAPPGDPSCTSGS